MQRKLYLQTFVIELLNSNLKLCICILGTPDHSPIHTSKTTFSNHECTAKVSCSVLELGKCEYPKIVWPLRETKEWRPPQRLITHIRNITRVELWAWAPCTTIRRRGAAGLPWCGLLRVVGFLLLSVRELKTLH